MSKHLQLSSKVLSSLAVFYLLTVSTASARQQLHGHVPRAVASAPMVGDVADTEPFHLAISLPFRNQDNLQTLIQNIYDPKNPQYHQYLTPEEFTDRFGPTPEDYQKLMDFVKSQGLSVAGTSPNRALLNVDASAADVRRVFHVNLHYYQRPDGSRFRSPDSEPSVDFDLPILHVGGLDNYAVPRSNMVKSRPKTKNYSNTMGNKINADQGTGPKDRDTNLYTYWGFDFRNIYACTSNTGSGQNIALFELDDYNQTYVTDYEKASKISPPYSPSITKVVVGTGFSSPGSNEDEVELDIEMAMSMAPSANIYVYETKTDDDNFDTEVENLLNAIANPGSSNPLCYEISSSWSWDESTFDKSVTQTFQQYAADGQSFFQASGDLGAYVADDPDTTVQMPMGETSFMTVVGGTDLTTTGAGGSSVGNYSSETTWNDSPGPSVTQTPPPNAVTSGGICTLLPIPTYQEPFVTSTPGSGASSTNRNIPDVAMVAIEIEICSEGQTYASGGTSAAAPLWAGLAALINATAANEAKGPIGFANPYLYNLAATSYTNDFNDITTGNNNYWGTNPNEYAAATGYDLTTGLGSPKCALIADLITPITTNTFTPTPTITNTPTITPTHTNTPTVTNTPTPPTTTSSYAYPQPAHGGQVYLVYNSDLAQPVRINIYSIVGQQVDSVMDNPQVSNQNRILVSLKNFAPGVYFYVINGLSTGTVLAKGKFLAVP